MTETKEPPASALYEGVVRHRRFAPVAHAFAYKLFLAYLDLAELPESLDAHPLWSARRRAPIWFNRADYLGDPGVSLEAAVRGVVEATGRPLPTGPVRMLTQLRTWGWCFNPLTLYYCFDPDGLEVETVVVDVSNTPWGERHPYVFSGPEAMTRTASADKVLHVSPFLPMGVRYRFGTTVPASELRVEFEIKTMFEAELELKRHPLDRKNMTNVMLRYPLMSHRVSAGIYAQAARLRVIGAPVYAHPHHAR